MKKREIALLLVLSVYLINFAGAEIYLSQPETLYNIGDNFNVSIELIPNEAKTDFFNVALICGSNQIELYKSIETLAQNEKLTKEIKGKFNDFIVGNFTGECYFKARYSNDEFSTQKFKIVDLVNIKFDIQGFSFKPGQDVKITGQALKANGELLNGFSELKIEILEISSIAQVVNGDFSFNFNLPENALSGNHIIKINAYEKDGSGNKKNKGEISDYIKVEQIIKTLELAIENNMISPGNEFSYKVLLYDQAGQEASKDVAITIFDPKNNIFQKRVVNSAEMNTFNIGKNYTPQDWSIEAKTLDLVDKRSFYVESVEDISLTLINQTLIVENIGNVFYDNPIEINIGDSVEVKDIKLEVGEKKIFKLVAPEGNYQIRVKQKDKIDELGTTFLTGRAISINEVGSIFNSGNYSALYLLAGILILALIIFFFYRMRKNRQMGISSTSSLNSRLTPMLKSSSQNIIDGGIKEESSIIAIKINNYRDVENMKGEGSPLATLEKALIKAREKGGKIYVSDLYRLVIFSESLTRSKENPLLAVNIASEVKRIFDEHNSSGKIRIDYGIALNMGNMIIERKEGKTNFVSVDNTLSISKKISGLSRAGDIILSESIHHSLLGKVKSERLREGNYWKLTKISNKDQHSDFIKGFMRRQERN